MKFVRDIIAKKQAKKCMSVTPCMSEYFCVSCGEWVQPFFWRGDCMPLYDVVERHQNKIIVRMFNEIIEPHSW